MGDSVARAIEAARVVVIARKGCSFSAEAVRLVQSRQLNHAVFDMSELAPGAHAELTQLTGQRTVPYVFVDGKHVGGASDLIELDASGRLTTMLASEGSVATTAAIYAPYGSAKPEYLPALWRFPHSVDVHVVRVTGVLCCILSIVLGVFGILERDWATYATLVFASDFALRLVGGAKASLVGSIAQLICARWRPQFKPGPSKQFASLVGTFMAVMAFVFYAIHSYALQLLGGIFLLILAFFAGLEGFANWCAGCWIFAMGIRFGVVSDTVYHVHAHEKGATVSAWDYGNLPHPDAPRPVRKTLSFRGHAESPIDIKYQVTSMGDSRFQSPAG